MVTPEREHISPGRAMDTTRQFIKVGDELLDVTSLNRPDPSWRYVDVRGHEHQWWADGVPATSSYSPGQTYALPTLIRVVDAEGDDDHPDTAHYECAQCRIEDGVGARYQDVNLSPECWREHVGVPYSVPYWIRESSLIVLLVELTQFAEVERVPILTGIASDGTHVVRVFGYDAEDR